LISLTTKPLQRNMFESSTPWSTSFSRSPTTRIRPPRSAGLHQLSQADLAPDLVEQHDEWAESRRYLGLDVLSKSRTTKDTPTEQEDTPAALTAWTITSKNHTTTTYTTSQDLTADGCSTRRRPIEHTGERSVMDVGRSNSAVPV
jgi:hypothetical protein